MGLRCILQPRYGHTIANARVLGTAQGDSFKAHSHLVPNGMGAVAPSQYQVASDYVEGIDFDPEIYTSSAGGAETRGTNTAFAPRLIAY